MDLALLPCTQLPGVSVSLAAKLAKLNIITVQDVLFHIPLRYEDRTRITPIADVREGDKVLIEGEIVFTEEIRKKRAMFIVRLQDQSGLINLKFFHYYPSQTRDLKAGVKLRCFGEIRFSYSGPEMIHPQYQRLSNLRSPEVHACLTPIYPSTEGVTQKTLLELTDSVLALFKRGKILLDELSSHIDASLNLPNLMEALFLVHRPLPDVSLQHLIQGTHPAIKRLALEEFMAHRLSLKRLRNKVREHQAPCFAKTSITEQFLKKLPFELTQAQKRVAAEIMTDMQNPIPMLRLLQGDVGSGKTVVAALAMLTAVENGHQAALMAPTEILAEQHYRNFLKWFKTFGLQIAWLAGKQGAKQKRSQLEDISLGNAHLIIGTHALFQESVHFNKLGLVVVDEQHRFGVEQRMVLRDKGYQNNLLPHQLVMSATPIPRTIAMSVYADLDVSIIDELPPGRKPIQTIALPENKREEIIARGAYACEQKRQVYWVCSLITESDALQCETAEKTYQLLCQNLPNLRIGLIHGKMAAHHKDSVMGQFKNHELDVLVATTIIEVGVDVPNATLMIIENAERFGLSQLHQLRGRVGRGAEHSFCVLLYKSPLSYTAKERLKIMRATQDGFEIAKKDLELRGPGEVLGTRQTGVMQFKIANLARDQDLLRAMVPLENKILQEHPKLANQIIKRWLSAEQKYAEV